MQQEDTLREEPQDEFNDGELFQIKSTRGSSSSPIVVEVHLDDSLVAMEVDTGASVFLMSIKVFRELWPWRSLSPTKVRLCNYNKTYSLCWLLCGKDQLPRAVIEPAFRSCRRVRTNLAGEELVGSMLPLIGDPFLSMQLPMSVALYNYY